MQVVVFRGTVSGGPHIARLGAALLESPSGTYGLCQIGAQAMHVVNIECVRRWKLLSTYDMQWLGHIYIIPAKGCSS